MEIQIFKNILKTEETEAVQVVYQENVVEIKKMRPKCKTEGDRS